MTPASRQVQVMYGLYPKMFEPYTWDMLFYVRYIYIYISLENILYIYIWILNKDLPGE